MALHKADISKLSINQLSLASGVAYNTVKKRLGDLQPVSKDGRTLFFNTPAALAKIFNQTESEKNRLDRLRADKTEMENDLMRGDSVPTDAVKFAIADFASQVKSTFESIPKRIKHSLPSLRAREMKILEREIVKAQNAASEIRVAFDIVEVDGSEF
jgi:phage terminase Nu1 subunit (DNA packaging protein)